MAARSTRPARILFSRFCFVETSFFCTASSRWDLDKKRTAPEPLFQEFGQFQLSQFRALSCADFRWHLLRTKLQESAGFGWWIVWFWSFKMIGRWPLLPLQARFWTFRMVSVEWFQQLFHQFCSRIVGTNFVRFRALYLFHSFDELQVCNPTFPENSWNLEINDCLKKICAKFTDFVQPCAISRFFRASFFW